MNKEEFLLSLPDSISLTEALSDVAAIFTKQRSRDQKIPTGDLEKYICFHKELKWGVYKHEDQYFLVNIWHPKKFLGIESKTTLMKVTEVLTDANDASYIEKANIKGNNVLTKTSDSEKLFLQAITDEGTKEAFKERQAEELRLTKLEEEREKAEEKRIANKKRAEEKSQREHLKRLEEAKEKQIANKKRAIAAKVAEENIKIRVANEKEKRRAKYKLLENKYGLEGSFRTEFNRRIITLDMPIEMVIAIKGKGHERKRNVTKDGEQIKEKYGKYFKTLSSGVKSTTPSYNLQVEYEKNDNNVWVVTGYKDL